MSRPLYRLIYCSRNVIAEDLTLDRDHSIKGEIRAILSIARQRNEADNLTGALLYTASGFAQVLEGDRDVVERTFERISRDPRHADVTALSFTPTERRSFPDWSMAFSGQPDPAKADPLAGLLSDATFAGQRATTAGDVLHLLEALVQREDEWIST